MNVTRCLSMGLVVILNIGGYKALAQTRPAAIAPAAEVPESIQVPADQQLLFSVTAQGEQIYLCQTTPDQPSQFAWTLKAPEAELFDQRKVPQSWEI